MTLPNYNILISELKDAKAKYNEAQVRLKAENDRLRRESEKKQKAIDAEKYRQDKEKRKALEAEEAKLNMNDKEKIADLITELQSVKIRYSFKSEKNKAMFIDIQNMIDQIIDKLYQNIEVPSGFTNN